MLDLDLLGVNVERQTRAMAVSGEEEAYYAEQQDALCAEIGRLEAEVHELKTQLARERLIRRNKDEYDAIAAGILEYPSRSDLSRALEEVESQMQAVGAQQTDIQTFIERSALAGYEAIEHLRRVRKQVEVDLGAIKD